MWREVFTKGSNFSFCPLAAEKLNKENVDAFIVLSEWRRDVGKIFFVKDFNCCIYTATGLSYVISSLRARIMCSEINPRAHNDCLTLETSVRTSSIFQGFAPNFSRLLS